MIFPYCTACGGIGRVCVGIRRTMTITEILPCQRCEGSGWEPKTLKRDERQAVTGVAPQAAVDSPSRLKVFNPEEMEL